MKEKYGYYRCQNDGCPLKTNVRREVMHEQFLDFASTLTPRPELVKMFRETLESGWVERYREVDARLSKVAGDGLRPPQAAYKALSGTHRRESTY
jgi:hypothetical protein